MAEAPEAEYAEAEKISFDLEQLTLSADHRLELAGRWFGVRGRRFMRPTLTLIGAQKRSRSLADLEHKPWAAEDGELWLAAFALQDPGEDVLELELAVAPDIAVMLNPPPELAQLPRERVPSSDAVRAPRAGSPPIATPAHRDERDTALEDELTSARAALEQRRLKIEKLEGELQRTAAADGEREAAARALADALRERDEALRERDEARTGWKKAHDGWRTALLERDQAVADRQKAIIERDRATAARDRALAERPPGPAPDQAQAPAPAAASAPDQAPAEHPPPQFSHRPVAPKSSHAPPSAQRPRARPAAGWAVRAFVLLVLLAAVITLVLIIQSA